MEKFNNKTLKDAVQEWLDNPANSEKKYGHISNWDTSEVTSMEALFVDAETFNEPLNNWDVSNVENMERMFNGASSFNQDISAWDVSNVTDMSEMFYKAKSFNQDIGNWDVSNVWNMNEMFYKAKSFNQDIGNWDVSNMTYMNGMFNEASSFNQDIGNWDVSHVWSMDKMFYKAKSFNQDTSSWDTTNLVYGDAIVNAHMERIDKAFHWFIKKNPVLEVICDEETMPQWYDFVKWVYGGSFHGVNECREGDIVTEGSYTFKISSLMEEVVWECVSWFDPSYAEEIAKDLTSELLMARASEVSGKVCGECDGDDDYCEQCYGTGFDVYDKDINWVYYDSAYRPGIYSWDDVKDDEIWWFHYKEAHSKILGSLDIGAFEKLSKINL